MKTCIKCGSEKDDLLFVKKTNICKDCKKLINANYRKENKEKKFHNKEKLIIGKTKKLYFLPVKITMSVIKKRNSSIVKPIALSKKIEIVGLPMERNIGVSIMSP